MYSGRSKDTREPAHLMRELISDFLNLLSSDLDINIHWCKLSNKKPTQRSNVIYIILGNDNNFNWEDISYRPYVNIANTYRDLYEDLNTLAHYRADNISPNIKIRLESTLAQLQNLTSEIIRLKEVNRANN